MEEYEDIIKKTEEAREQVDGGANKLSIDAEKKIYEQKCSSTVLLKFLTSMEYGIEDVNEVLEQIETTTGEKVSCIVASNLDTLKAEFKKKTWKTGSSPLFIIYLTPMDRVWILAAIITDQDKDMVLFKDPIGAKIDDELRAFFKDQVKIADDNILSNDLRKEEKEKSQYRDLKDFSGPITIRNLLKIHHECKTVTTQNTLVTDFKKWGNFVAPSGLDADKKLMVIAMATDFAKSNTTFLNELTMKVNDLKPLVGDYDKKGEAIKNYLTANKNSTYAELEKERKKHYNTADLDKTKAKMEKKTKGKDDSKETTPDVPAPIESTFAATEEEYPTEMATLKLLCTILSGCVKDENVEEALKQLKQLFKLPPEWLPKLMEDLLNKDKDDLVEDGDVNIPVFPKDLSDVRGNDKFEAERAGGATRGESGIEDIIQKIDFPDPEDKKTHKDTLHDLGDHYKTFQKYMAKYDTWSSNQVHNWATGNKNSERFTNEKVCEALAVVNRALKIKTGHFMRYPQICACLVMLLTGNRSHGKLLQIKTGEGKTVTVGVMAIILALQGYKVDVITSNNVLAMEGVVDTLPWTNLMDLSVGCNKYEATAKPDEKDADDKKLMEQCPFKGDGQEKLCNNWLERVTKYKHDIVYGAISNFQFDYLKDTAENQNERKKRPFQYLILDEVDNMLIDNGGHIAKLAEPFPGMESLRYVYMNIWTQLNIISENRLKDLETRADNKLKDLGKDKSNSRKDIKDKFEEFVKDWSEEMDSIKADIKKANLYKLNFIPDHIQEYAKLKLDKLVEMACFAKWGAGENENYIITKPRVETEADKTNESRDPADFEPKVVPVDNENTGVILRSTIWSYGLHQFVQLKHNLSLTFESLTSSYISNLGYIKKYVEKKGEDKTTRIFGVTGTLGGEYERTLLKKLFDLEFVLIPPYAPSNLHVQTEKHKIITDESWPDAVAVEAFMEAKERGVLVICNSIKDVELIADCCEILKKLKPTKHDLNIRRYYNESHGSETKNEVMVGDVILATNLAGRGTNFHVNNKVKGGLHVIVGFLPCNARVEEQAFGRTGRQGAKGTAVLIIRRNEVKEGEGNNFGTIFVRRNASEKERLDKIKKDDLKLIEFKDELFEYFAGVYSHKKRVNMIDPDGQFFLRDLKENWARWLEKQKWEVSSDIKTSAKDAFNDFKKQMAFGSDYDLKNQVAENPYYDILRIEHYIDGGETKSAQTIIDNLNNPPKGKKNKVQNIASFHMYHFEIAVDKGEQMYHRLMKFTHDLFDFGDWKYDEGTYQTDSVKALEKARTALEMEIDYLNKTVLQESYANNLFNYKITTPEDGGKKYLEKYLLRRGNALDYHYQTCGKLLGAIDKYKNKKHQFSIDTRQRSYLVNSSGMVEEDRKKYADVEIEARNLKDVGLHTCYTLKEMQDITKDDVVIALAFIGAGVAFILAGIAFLPAAGFTLPIGIGLVSEGIIDIIMKLLEKADGQEKSDAERAKYIRDKIISALTTLASALLSGGISIMPGALAKAAISTCKFCSKVLEFFNKYVMEFLKFLKLGKFVDKIGEFTGAMNKIANGAQKITKYESRLEYLKDFGKGVFGNVKKGLPKLAEQEVEKKIKSLLIEIPKKLINHSLEKNPSVNNSIGKLGKKKLKLNIEEFCQSSSKLKQSAQTIYQIHKAKMENSDGIDLSIFDQPEIHDAIGDLLQDLSNKAEKASSSSDDAMGDEDVNNLIKVSFAAEISAQIAKKYSDSTPISYLKDIDETLACDLERGSNRIIEQWAAALDMGGKTANAKFKKPKGMSDEEIYKSFLFTLCLMDTDKYNQDKDNYGEDMKKFIDDQIENYKVLKALFDDFQKNK